MAGCRRSYSAQFVWLVDTGIHSKGWTREQVVEFMRKSGAVDEPTIQLETDRYIAWPGQAPSYKLGQLKISELRQRTQKELGANFDIRTFHYEILRRRTITTGHAGSADG